MHAIWIVPGLFVLMIVVLGAFLFRGGPHESSFERSCYKQNGIIAYYEHGKLTTSYCIVNGKVVGTE